MGSKENEGEQMQTLLRSPTLKASRQSNCKCFSGKAEKLQHFSVQIGINKVYWCCGRNFGSTALIAPLSLVKPEARYQLSKEVRC